MQNPIAIRIDDIGSSAKAYEIYGKTRISIGNFSVPFPGNFLFLKLLKPFKKWGPYPELLAHEWENIFHHCELHKLKLTLGVTAGWVERSGKIIPFPEKYSKQAAIIKRALNDGLVEIANHGYTHCVMENRAFRPRLFSSNRKWHREFWDWIPLDVQENHIATSQRILESFFSVSVVTFIPPGNVYTDNTLRIAKQYGLRYLSCLGIDCELIQDLIPIPERQVVALHDKDIVERGIECLSKNVETKSKARYVFVRELGMALEARA